MRIRTPYEILGVSPMDSPEEIKQSYRKLARRFHPDICKEPGAEARMKEINAAYTAIQKGQARITTPQQDWIYDFMRTWAERSYQQPKPESPPITREEKIKYCQQHPESISDAFLTGLLVGGQDLYSNMHVAELMERLNAEEVAIFSEEMGEKSSKVRANCLRWYARGLPLKLACRKALLDEKLYG